MSELRKIAILGSGNAGCSISADLTLGGFDVNLFELPEFENSIKPIVESGGIEISGSARNGFAEINKVTTDIEEALEGVKVIMIAVPAFGQEHFAKICSPYLKKGQIVVLCPGSQFGAIEFANVLRDRGIDILNEVMLGETISLIYSCRRYGSSQTHVFAVKENLAFSTLPARNTSKALDVLRKIYPQLVPATNVLETSIYSLNAIMHPPLMILNAVAVETGAMPNSAHGAPPVEKLTEAIDEETMNIAKTVRLKAIPTAEWLKRFYSEGVPFAHKDAPYTKKELTQNYRGGTLKMRYLTEDVPYGLVPLASLGDMLDVPTPMIDSTINLASAINETDYWSSGRTMNKLGITDFTVDELIAYVNELRALTR